MMYFIFCLEYIYKAVRGHIYSLQIAFRCISKQTQIYKNRASICDIWQWPFNSTNTKAVIADLHFYFLLCDRQYSNIQHSFNPYNSGNEGDTFSVPSLERRQLIYQDIKYPRGRQRVRIHPWIVWMQRGLFWHLCLAAFPK